MVKPIFSNFQLRMRRRLYTYLLSLTALYALSGFILAPWILHAYLEKRLSDSLRQQVRIESLRLNPFTLSATLRNVQIRDEAKNETLASLKELYLNLELRSLVEKIPAFSEVNLLEPRIRLGRGKDGSINFASLVEEKQQEASDTPSHPKPLPRLIFDKLEIQGGGIDFYDLRNKEQFSFEINPLRIELLDFRTAPGASTEFSLRAQNHLSNKITLDGALSLDPFAIDGVMDLHVGEPGPLINYFAQGLSILPPQGQFHWKTRYRFDAKEDLLMLIIDSQHFDLHEAAPRNKTNGDIVARLPEFSLGLAFDFFNRQVAVKHVRAKGGELYVRPTAGGGLNIDTLLTGEQRAPPEAEVKKISPWKFTISNAEFADFTLVYQGEREKAAYEARLNHVDLRIEHADAASVRAICKVNPEGGGRIASEINGTRNPAHLLAVLQVQDVDLAPFGSLLTAGLPARFQQGKFNFQGTIKLQNQESETARLSLRGNASINDFLLHEVLGPSGVFTVPAVEVQGLNLQLNPNNLSIENVRLATPNLVLRLDTAAQYLPAAGLRKTDIMPYDIEKISIDNGRFYLRDEALQPVARGSLTDVKLRLRNVRSGLNASMRLFMKAGLDSQGKIILVTQIVPNSPLVLQSLRLKLSDIPLAVFSPYTIKYLGRSIKQGKLYADMRNIIKDDVVMGENFITLDHVYFGDPRDEEPKIDLPISTALSLLRDSNGKVVLDLPVEGDLRSPSISYRRLVWQSLQSVIIEAAASPLTLLGTIYDFSSEELSHVDFAPASFEISVEEKEKLQVIGKALADRPGLRLEIQSAVAAELDAQGDIGELGEALQDLAHERAAAIRADIMAGYGIESSRIYFLEPLVLPAPAEPIVKDRTVRVKLAIRG